MPTNPASGTMPQFDLNFGSGSPDGTFLPGATTPNVSAMYVNLTANGNATAGAYPIAGSLATLGPTAGGAEEGNPALHYGSYDNDVDKPSSANSPATFNAADGESSTEVYVTALVSASHTQQGTPAPNSAPAIAGCTSVQNFNWYGGNPSTSSSG